MIQQIFAEPGVLHVIISGKFSLAEAKTSFIGMLDSVSRNKAHKVLIDGRDLKGNLKVMERFYYGEFVAHAVARSVEGGGISYPPKFAYLLTPPIRDPGRFGETVAANRGMFMRTFENIDDAFAWLGLAQAKVHDRTGRK
jgi:hypothetical protein